MLKQGVAIKKEEDTENIFSTIITSPRSPGNRSAIDEFERFAQAEELKDILYYFGVTSLQIPIIHLY